jgi:uncharacterized membrane protein YjfL (UPF0719 family)
MELIITFASIASAYYWFLWYLSTWPGNLNKLMRGVVPWLLILVPVLCAAIIWYVVNVLAASDVVSNLYYILLYFGLGVAWLKVSEFLFRFFGISAELDVVERGNPAALVAYTGGLLGVSLCYSGGNIGEGPGPQAVIICAGMATIAYFLVWFVLTAFTQVDYTITVDRDLATGLRLGSFLLATGLILGRAVVGDYISAVATWNDFVAHAWPVLPLLAIAIIFDYFTKPTVESPVQPPLIFGVLPSAIYIGSAIVYLLVGYIPL